ncbi:hypothetical protein [Nostoc sp.]|uniref:hypothetical protein n=1 Tax=Nostoc sp. TaxID=1180 RepID=UPI002FFC0F18
MEASRKSQVMLRAFSSRNFRLYYIGHCLCPIPCILAFAAFIIGGWFRLYFADNCRTYFASVVGERSQSWANYRSLPEKWV